MLSLSVYIPTSHVDVVKQALFDAGAGKIGNYDRCSWQVLGEGQFRPLELSSPALGQQGELSQVEEYKVEMVCQEDNIVAVVKALKKVHPYEEPAYFITKPYSL